MDLFAPDSLLNDLDLLSLQRIFNQGNEKEPAIVPFCGTDVPLYLPVCPVGGYVGMDAACGRYRGGVLNVHTRSA